MTARGVPETQSPLKKGVVVVVVIFVIQMITALPGPPKNVPCSSIVRCFKVGHSFSLKE